MLLAVCRVRNSVRVAGVAWLLMVAGVLVGPARSAEGDGPAKVALLVGVNQYRNRILVDRPLQYAERDVEELSKELRTQGFTVRLLMGSARGRDEATKANIEAALADVLKGRSAKDIVLLGFAGHGSQLPLRDVDGRIQKDSEGNTLEDAFYCPKDATVGEGESMVSLTRMMQTLNRKGGVNLLLVDACRDNPDPGRGTRSITGNELNGRLPANTAIVFSCAAGQQAFETEKAGGGHGVFFFHVLQGLRGEAANKGGAVTWNSLVSYVQDQVDGQAKSWLPNELTKRAARLRRDTDETDLQTPHELRNLVTVPVLGRKRVDLVQNAEKAGEEWDGNGLRMKFCWCPEVTYTVQVPVIVEKPKSEGGKEVVVKETQYVFEQRQLSGFWMGKFEVTQSQWQTVMGTTLDEQRRKTSEQRLAEGGPNLPMGFVNYDDAKRFCRKLTKQERDAGRLAEDWEFRLPREFEWQYASHTGKEPEDEPKVDPVGLREIAWFSLNAAAGARTVGTRRANSWGVHDLQGNVQEWVSEVIEDDQDAAAPAQTQPAAKRLERPLGAVYGGSWESNAKDCGMSSWEELPIDSRRRNIGFRVVASKVLPNFPAPAPAAPAPAPAAPPPPAAPAAR